MLYSPLLDALTRAVKLITGADPHRPPFEAAWPRPFLAAVVAAMMVMGVALIGASLYAFIMRPDIVSSYGLLIGAAYLGFDVFVLRVRNAVRLQRARARVGGFRVPPPR